MNRCREMLAGISDNHWRGKLSLAFNIVVSVLVIRIALSEVQSPAPVAALPLVVVISVSLLIWQVVGGWRAIESHTRTVGNMATVWAGFAAIVIALALTVMQILGALVRRAAIPAERYAEFTLRMTSQTAWPRLCVLWSVRTTQR